MLVVVTGTGLAGGFFGGRPGRRFIGVPSVTVGRTTAATFSAAGVDTATGRIFGLPALALRFPFPENVEKSQSLDVDEDDEEDR